ncbi:hypothetical protein SAMN05446927_7768 [Caballeronia arationis]|jgi:hypothetical protein|uniref:Uncharacterized protein n=1 Tax=Caballeronia arationis TaxID=1777142 RepID=A0A7Z7IFT7_9BURK|nr:hypothetical protein [Caballeronia arationis]SOE89107.1 hypothetical protein SAMN05446927_7768 [Caballeronia arationis]
MDEAIVVGENAEWVNKTTRPSCKYAPVVVSKTQTGQAMQTMRDVLQKRIDLCRQLGIENNNSALDGVGWFSFLRSGPSHEPHLRSTNVPVIVISGGSALKIVRELTGKDSHRLAWHPANLRNEPLYLLVHRLDFTPYVSALRGVMAQFRNMHVIGWDGGKMTGFGAARAAALAFADSLPYRPGRILMMDQDVVQTDGTRHTSPRVMGEVTSLHGTTGKPIVGYGVGYPTRQKVPGPFDQTGVPSAADCNSPAQQFVSVTAPFRRKFISGKADGIYPTYMVAGGEDMLAGFHLEMMKDDCNVALRNQVIVKKDLTGPADPNNQYWNVARVETLKRLYDVEKKTKLKWNGLPISLQHLMMIFSANSLIKPLPDPEVYNTAACVIERIILRLHKLEPFSPQAVFLNRKR